MDGLLLRKHFKGFIHFGLFGCLEKEKFLTVTY